MRAFDAVAMDTPASWATSRRVTARPVWAALSEADGEPIEALDNTFPPYYVPENVFGHAEYRALPALMVGARVPETGHDRKRTENVEVLPCDGPYGKASCSLPSRD
ncbi:hypothetical protein Ade02nite_57300 [Paractinoplanes deccanensis]|uniref:Uncharacterized protein n=1 Tax=Paractinoplanes deccanensis TaxID=113561 RepID=A0ABQ3YAR1_9ACTN|nr:hypothetical protein Ade02nite_57300 [Actinoplanes deccanensis]